MSWKNTTFIHEEALARSNIRDPTDTRSCIGAPPGTWDVLRMLCEVFPETLPKYLSTDNDPLFKSAAWSMLMYAFQLEELKSTPRKPWTHPFVERVIGSTRREYLNQTFFWTKLDLERKLSEYQKYFNEGRVHSGICGKFPAELAGEKKPAVADLDNFGWESFCNGRFKTPVAA